VKKGGILLPSAELSAAELLQGFQAILHRLISAIDFISTISHAVPSLFLSSLSHPILLGD
jgi:hypothetical protein